jgi:DNA-binding MarR family transcriptional regulator
MGHPPLPSPETRDGLLLAIPQLLTLVGAVTVRAGDDLVFEKFGLNVPRFAILERLSAATEPIKMTDLRMLIMKSSSNVTQHVDALEKRRLVKRVRSRTDRRVSFVQITPAGLRLLDDVRAFFLERMREYLAEYSDSDLGAFHHLLLRYLGDASRLLGLDPCEAWGEAL